jgi:hypothetical protein
LPVAVGKYHGLFVELKAPDGRLSEAQKGWLDALDKQNYCAAVCYGLDAAVECITQYLEGLL